MVTKICILNQPSIILFRTEIMIIINKIINNSLIRHFKNQLFQHLLHKINNCRISKDRLKNIKTQLYHLIQNRMDMRCIALAHLNLN